MKQSNQNQQSHKKPATVPLTKYSDHLIAEGQSGVDRIEDRAEAVYALINAE